MRLLTGSWGSLALITQLTLRTQPLPSHRKCFAVTGRYLPCSNFAKTCCFVAPLALERLEWNHQVGEISLWLSLVSLNPEGLLQQQEQLKALLVPELQWQSLEWEPNSSLGKQDDWLLRVGVEPQRAEALLEQTAIRPWQLQLGAASGLGLAQGQAASHQVADLRKHCEALGGYLTVLQAPQAMSSLPWRDAEARLLSRPSNGSSIHFNNSAADAYPELLPSKRLARRKSRKRGAND